MFSCEILRVNCKLATAAGGTINFGIAASSVCAPSIVNEKIVNLSSKLPDIEFIFPVLRRNFAGVDERERERDGL